MNTKKIIYNDYDKLEGSHFLEHWDTIDLNRVDVLVTLLCDFHLENASFGDQENDAEIQFGNLSWFVYAYEVLSWLKARELKEY